MMFKLFLVTVVALLLCGTSSASPLHDAAIARDVFKLKELLDSKQYDINGLNSMGQTPLAAAMATCSNYTGKFPASVPDGKLVFCSPGINDKDAIAPMLICAGADVNVDAFGKARPGYKLVHIAACHGANALYYLLSAGANPNTPYKIPETGQTVTPLSWAVMCEKKITNNTEYGYPGLFFERLLEAGANPLPEGPSKPLSALFWDKPPVAKCNKPGACTKAEMDKLLDSIDNISDPAFKGFNKGEWRELWEAQEKAFANPKASPELAAWAKRGREYACTNAADYYKGEVEARKNKQTDADYKQRYPLHIAVAANDLPTIKALVEQGKAGVNDKDDKGFTPLQVGMDCEKTAPWWCWPRVNDATAEYLVSKGANVKLDFVDRGEPVPGYTLLHYASFRGLTRLVRVLLRGGADINAVYKKPGSDGTARTPLYEAARCDFRLSMNDGPGADSTNGTIKTLLEAGAKPWVTTKDDKQEPIVAFMSAPGGSQFQGWKKCAKVGACTAAEIAALQKDGTWASVSGTCPQSWLVLWRASNGNSTSGKAAAPAAVSGRKLLRARSWWRW